jgi:DHA2 family multidrug resistance protein
LYNPLTRERLDALAGTFVVRGFDASSASRMALGALDAIVRKQSYLLAYGDCFFLVGVIVSVSGIITFAAKRASGGRPGGAH